MTTGLRKLFQQLSFDKVAVPTKTVATTPTPTSDEKMPGILFPRTRSSTSLTRSTTLLLRSPETPAGEKVDINQNASFDPDVSPVQRHRRATIMPDGTTSLVTIGVSRLERDASFQMDADDDSFVHINQWFESTGCDPCSKTETIYLCPFRSEEPVTSNMDISTGHIVLSYMEDHLQNKDRLDQEWEALCAYEAEPNSGDMATQASNMRKNRYTDILPYDHSRVVLSTATNVSGSDYINASSITDHDPRNPAYIATQGPLPHTVADFWQMVWEQGSVIIVDLTKLTENGVSMCHRYWPEEGSDLYHIYEVHLVSEHIWCDDYLVRSFYLKNLQTNETRTVTQFHFLTWTDLGVPSSAKALLEFRRKVNKSYRGRSCPVIVQCSDGSGRSGTYTLIDMVLNRMSKGAKEIDIAATLEHIRDQRMQMVKTKEQFEFALASVAEEVHAILKALPQQ